MICTICFEKIYFSFFTCICKRKNIYYHKSCIKEWYKQNKVCPICKTKETREPFISNLFFLVLTIFFDIGMFFFIIYNDYKINKKTDFKLIFKFLIYINISSFCILKILSFFPSKIYY